MRRMLLLTIALLAPVATIAADAPRVTDVRFEGNRVTRERVLLREMALGPGDRAEPMRIEQSRQAILDLGLFREVDIEPVPNADGVDLVVRVREKRFLLPIPRVDTSSDRDYSYGAQLRWSNVGGRNHSFNAYLERGRFPEERDREREQSARLAYTAPHVFDTPWMLRATAEHIERQVPSDGGGYDEDLQRVQLHAAYDLRAGRPRHGWLVGGGVFLHRQDAAGPVAPPADGRATALVATAEYDDLRFLVYSERGRRLSARLESARRGWGSDYSYSRLNARYQEWTPIGTRPHQSLHVLAEAGLYSGGTGRRNHFSLGGSSRLRGYDVDHLEGDRFAYLAAEFLRPVARDWLRLLAVAELGVAGRDVEGVSRRGLHASIGIGARIRLTWFVNVEVELGLAWPLRGGGGTRFFAGGEG